MTRFAGIKQDIGLGRRGQDAVDAHFGLDQPPAEIAEQCADQNQGCGHAGDDQCQMLGVGDVRGLDIARSEINEVGRRHCDVVHARNGAAENDRTGKRGQHRAAFRDTAVDTRLDAQGNDRKSESSQNRQEETHRIITDDAVQMQGRHAHVCMLPMPSARIRLAINSRLRPSPGRESMIKATPAAAMPGSIESAVIQGS